MALITGLIGAIKGENLIMNIESIADLILGHESSLDAGILHHDVSIGNIMLTENEDDGFLIDYDLAIKVNSVRASGAPSKTGTKVFMAIGALLGEPHSFMHDLESFFWMLFWICIHYDGLSEKGRSSAGPFRSMKTRTIFRQKDLQEKRLVKYRRVFLTLWMTTLLNTASH